MVMSREAQKSPCYSVMHYFKLYLQTTVSSNRIVHSSGYVPVAANPCMHPSLVMPVPLSQGMATGLSLSITTEHPLATCMSTPTMLNFAKCCVARQPLSTCTHPRLNDVHMPTAMCSSLGLHIQLCKLSCLLSITCPCPLSHLCHLVHVAIHLHILPCLSNPQSDHTGSEHYPPMPKPKGRSCPYGHKPRS